MAIAHERVVVAATATKVADAERDRDGFTVMVQNPAGGASVFIGGPGVTTSSFGYEVVAGAEIGVELTKDEELYAVVATGTITVNVLRIGV